MANFLDAIGGALKKHVLDNPQRSIDFAADMLAHAKSAGRNPESALTGLLLSIAQATGSEMTVDEARLLAKVTIQQIKKKKVVR